MASAWNVYEADDVNCDAPLYQPVNVYTSVSSARTVICVPCATVSDVTSCSFIYTVPKPSQATFTVTEGRNVAVTVTSVVAVNVWVASVELSVPYSHLENE